MSAIGRRAIESCSRQPNCITREQHDSCSMKENYQYADHKVLFDDFYSTNVSNFMSPINDFDIPMEVDESIDHESKEANKKEENATGEFIACKNCNKAVKKSKIIIHLTNSKKGCKDGYGNLEDMITQRDKERKEYLKHYKKKYNELNADKIRKTRARKNAENSDSINQKRREKYKLKTIVKRKNFEPIAKTEKTQPDLNKSQTEITMSRNGGSDMTTSILTIFDFQNYFWLKFILRHHTFISYA